MDTKKIIRKIAPALWVLGALLLVMIIVGWFVEYPAEVKRILNKVLLVLLALALLFKAWQIRVSDRKFAYIYLITASVLLIVVFLSFEFVQFILFAGLLVYLFSNKKVRDLLNKQEKNPNT